MDAHRHRAGQVTWLGIFDSGQHTAHANRHRGLHEPNGTRAWWAARKMGIRLDRGKVAFGYQIRNYVMQPYQLVKDVRTEVETGDIQRVLDGDIDRFIQAYLRSRMGSPATERRQGPKADRGGPLC